MSFYDHRTSSLLSRVRDDVSHLRQDIRNLVGHTARRTLPREAKELADSAYDQISAGGAYAAKRLRSLRSHAPSPALGIVGGVILVGALAAGVYALLNCNCAKSAEEELEDELERDIPV